MTGSEILYLYGFVPERSPRPDGELEGLEGGAVEVVGLDGFHAVVSRVPAEGYRDDVLSARLKDLSWVGRRGLEHERVVTWFVDHAGILPARIFTLYTSRHSLVDEAASGADRIVRLLDRFEDLREWHLKAAYDIDRLVERLGEASEEVRALDEEIEVARPGRRYLLRRKRDELARQRAGAVARELADELHRHVDGLIRESRALDVPDGNPGRVVLNAALLAERAREQELRDELETCTAEFGRRGLDVEFSGPWAPYRFLPDEATPRECVRA